MVVVMACGFIVMALVGFGFGYVYGRIRTTRCVKEALIAAARKRGYRI